MSRPKEDIQTLVNDLKDRSEGIVPPIDMLVMHPADEQYVRSVLEDTGEDANWFQPKTKITTSYLARKGIVIAL